MYCEEHIFQRKDDDIIISLGRFIREFETDYEDYKLDRKYQIKMFQLIPKKNKKELLLKPFKQYDVSFHSRHTISLNDDHVHSFPLLFLFQKPCMVP